MITKCDKCHKRTNTNRFCICHSCVLNDRCEKAIDHCRERNECPIDSFESVYASIVAEAIKAVKEDGE